MISAWETTSIVCGRSNAFVGMRVPEITGGGAYGLAPSTLTYSESPCGESVSKSSDSRPAVSTSRVSGAKPALTTVTRYIPFLAPRRDTRREWRRAQSEALSDPAESAPRHRYDGAGGIDDADFDRPSLSGAGSVATATVGTTTAGVTRAAQRMCRTAFDMRRRRMESEIESKLSDRLKIRPNWSSIPF